MVDTGAEFASPSGAPLGYEPGGPVGEVLRGAKEQQALVERVVQSGQRRLARVWLVLRDGVHVRVELRGSEPGVVAAEPGKVGEGLRTSTKNSRRGCRGACAGVRGRVEALASY